MSAMTTIDALITDCPNQSVIVKLPSNAYVQISDRQQRLFCALFDAAEQLNTAHETLVDRIKSVLLEQYGDAMPAYEQYKDDRRAMTILALERGLVDDQWIRKPYCAAIKSLYGALPVSSSGAANAKRAARAAIPKAVKPVMTGADLDDDELLAELAKPIVPVNNDMRAEQLIASIGVAQTLRILTKILATERSSQLHAKTLASIAACY